MSTTEAEIVERLKVLFPPPWFTKWWVKVYYGRDENGRETQDAYAYQAMVQFIANDRQ